MKDEGIIKIYKKETSMLDYFFDTPRGVIMFLQKYWKKYTYDRLFIDPPDGVIIFPD